jgi:hypothetical protein
VDSKLFVVVTSIAAPTGAMRAIARGCARAGARFLVIGDAASPPDFRLDGCEFYGVAEQRATQLNVARLCPTKTYARKNVGYLLAARAGADIIVDTDDDNVPSEAFWSARHRDQDVPCVDAAGWVNVYRYFCDAGIWPRGFPLERVLTAPPPFDDARVRRACCPIQQGLVTDQPDVDAIYRLVDARAVSFRSDRRVALGAGAWCPFNSQNSSWWREAFPLLYLPAHCAFRTADIWRSFVAQRIAWTNGWSILFHEATVTHARNEHDLLVDFRQELPGYLYNGAIGEALAALPLTAGVDNLGHNLRACYEKLVSMGAVGAEELSLLNAWLTDMRVYP